MFCSFLRFPAHTSNTGLVTFGMEQISFMVNVFDFLGRFEDDVVADTFVQSSTAIRCPSHVKFGTAPWFLTKCKLVGVTSPLSSNILSSGSQLNGCVPVNRTSLSCRATQWSGVLQSFTSGRVASASYFLSDAMLPPFSSKSFVSSTSSIIIPAIVVVIF